MREKNILVKTNAPKVEHFTVNSSLNSVHI